MANWKNSHLDDIYTNIVNKYLYTSDIDINFNCPEPEIKISNRSANNVEIVRVIFNDPATVVFWSDNTKTVVKADSKYEDVYDPEKGLAMAISKKFIGKNSGRYYNIFKKWLPKENLKKEN